MAIEVQNYIDLITSEYYNNPKFTAMTRKILEKDYASTSILEHLWDYFKLDTATGSQLDIIGQYLNITRELPIDSSVLPDVLTDDLYRLVLKARVLQYHWDGTIEGIYKITLELLPDALIWLVDNQDGSYQMLLMSPNFDDQIAELFILGYITPKPAGIKVTYTLFEKAFFAWDKNDQYYKGWDNSVWLR